METKYRATMYSKSVIIFISHSLEVHVAPHSASMLDLHRDGNVLLRLRLGLNGCERRDDSQLASVLRHPRLDLVGLDARGDRVNSVQPAEDASGRVLVPADHLEAH